MLMLRAIIIDDEEVARKTLREELEQISDIAVIGEANNGRSALHAIEHTAPDLVFLDVELSDLKGFEIIHSLNGHPDPPGIIVVTSLDQYVIPALEAGVIDYILKPASEARLVHSIERVRRLRSSRQLVAAQAQAANQPTEADAKRWLRKIAGKLKGEYVLLDPAEVFAFKAEGEVVWIITANKKYEATHTLSALQERLQNTSFQRVHRNALVNTDHIRKMSALSSQRWLVTLRNELEFIVSKRQANIVRQLLSL
jgi:two-component system LytT family response regulator